MYNDGGFCLSALSAGFVWNILNLPLFLNSLQFDVSSGSKKEVVSQ